MKQREREERCEVITEEGTGTERERGIAYSSDGEEEGAGWRELDLKLGKKREGAEWECLARKGMAKRRRFLRWKVWVLSRIRCKEWEEEDEDS